MGQSEQLLFFALFSWSTPSCLKVRGGWGGVGGPCDYCVNPSPFGLDFGTLDLGLTIIESYFYFIYHSALHTPRAVESVALGLQSRQTGSEESHVSNKKCLLYHKIQTVSNLHMF